MATATRISSRSLHGAVSVQVSLNAVGQKPCYANAAVHDFGHDAVAGTVGEFAGTKGADVLMVFADGPIRLAWNFDAKENRSGRTEAIGQFPSPLAAPALMAAGDMDGGGRDEAILVEAGGGVWRISLAAAATPKATVIGLGSLEKDVSAIAIAQMSGKRADTLVYETADG